MRRYVLVPRQLPRPLDGSVGYEPIAEQLFNEIDLDAFLLKFDSERAGSFEPLR